MQIKKYTISLLLFLALEIVAGYFFYQIYTNGQNAYYERSIKEAQAKFSSTEHIFSVLSNDFFNNHGQDIARMIAAYEAASSAKKEKVRALLLKEFSEFHTNQKLLGLEVFHIFDKEGRSILRFHQVEKYGDPIYKKRYSLRAMRKDFTYQAGLEIGLFKESFRFQFPLFYDGEFVGSYEYGIGFKAMAREMNRLYSGDYLFLLKKEAIDASVKQEVIAQRYGEFSLNRDYLYLKNAQNIGAVQNKRRHPEKQEYISKGLKTAQPFAFGQQVNSEAYTLVFMPVKDIEGTQIAYIVSRYKGNPDQEHLYALILDMFLATLLFVGLIALFYLVDSKRRYVKNILDTMKDMIVLTDGKKIQDVNQRLLQFFGYKSLQLFKQEHDCVCDFFIEEEGYLSKDVSTLNWIDYIKIHPNEKYKVKMADTNGIVFVFMQEYSEFKKGVDAVITFHDITLSEMEHEKLEERAFTDTLTGIFNRERFNFFLETELARTERYETLFSLVMFDIDHFKEVNDTYGHDVGDKVLKTLTQLVQGQIRDSDVFARWGGEEFMIITPNNLGSSEQLAEKLRCYIHEHVFDTVGNVTCSFGVTQSRKGDAVETIVKRCDEMLYTAKHSGRNCVVSIR